jgi:hypothetical protein
VVVAACGPGPEDPRHTDILFWNGVYYQAPFASTGRELTDNDLGPEQFRVRRQVSDGRIALTDRDAAYVPEGTPVFKVAAYRTSFRLAARHDGRIFVYESTPHSGATRGADLLDLEGHVAAVAFLERVEPDVVLTRLDDRARLDALVGMISIAPVDISGPWGNISGKGVFLAFDLTDGTRTVRHHDQGRGVFADVIRVGDEFNDLIEEVLRSAPCAPRCFGSR